MAVGLPIPTITADPVPSAVAPPTPPMIVAEDEVFTIGGLEWDQYVAINDALGDRAGLRLLFLDGSLTFVSPAIGHEWRSDSLDRILFAIAIGCEIELCPIGSTTLRRPKNEAGAEGDRVYYLRDNALLIGRRETLDLVHNPSPDLAIEVENTHKATDAVAIYARLGIPEVWRYNVRRRTFSFGALGPDGTYQEVPQSVALPFLTPGDVLHQLERAEEFASFNGWFLQLTNWVRDVIRPRLDVAPTLEERP